MPNLDNSLKGFFIDGKPVKKASLDGKVFFEKHDYNLDVSASESIIQIDDSTTITARLTDYNEPVEGETCFIYDSDKAGTGYFTVWNITYSTFILNLNNEGSLVLSRGGLYRIYNDEGDLTPAILTTSTNQWTFTVSDGKLHIYEYGNEHDYGNYDVTDDLKIEFSPHEGSIVTSSFPTIFHIGTTDSSGECSVGYVGKGTGDLNIKAEVPERSLVSETYIEDCVLFNQNEIIVNSRVEYPVATVNQDFILSFDYYPTDYWEWLRFTFDTTNDENYIVFSSSYDKSGKTGFTDLGYNKWVNSLSVKREGDIVTATYNGRSLTKDASNYNYPVTPILFPNRNNSRFRNVKLKLI